MIKSCHMSKKILSIPKFGMRTIWRKQAAILRENGSYAMKPT